MAEKLEHYSLHDKLLDITILRLSSTHDIPLYHVHQKGERICDNFLLGCCPLQDRCPRHHTPFPYHWQWWQAKDQVWLSFSLSAQHNLERLYCDTATSSVELLDRTGLHCSLNLDNPKHLQFADSYRVRRLSNSSNPACNPYFPEELKVYWKEEDEWKEYMEPIGQELVAAFEKGMWNHAFSLNDRIYNVNIKHLTQCNMKTGYVRDITYRPVLRSYADIAPYLRSLAPSLHDAAIPGEDPLDLYCGPYPAAWVPSPKKGSVFTMAEMTLSETAYQKVKLLFHATLPESEMVVLAIYRIRNNKLWKKYMRQKRLMSRRRTIEDQASLEKHLFHGTAAPCIKPICKENFDIRLSGLHGAVFGRGIYFAKDASYSHDYTTPAKYNVHHMFLTKVLTGYWLKGSSRYRRCPTRYNSCTDCTFDPNIFVIFKNCQCYPYFLIRYKEMNTPVAVDL